MKHETSIKLLNKAVGDELQAIHQYMYFHFHLDDQGFGPLAMLFKRTAIEEMTHVELLAERILFLGGDVDMTPAAGVEQITEPEKMLSKAAQMEQHSAHDYNKSALACSEAADSASKQIFEQLVGDEERHFDQYDTQMDNIKRFGPNYLALQSFGKGEGGGTPEA